MKPTVENTKGAVPESQPTHRRLNISVRRKPRVSAGYGRFVGVMRVLLPTVATGLIILVALWPQLSDRQRRLSITPTKIDAEAAKDLKLANGVYTGVDEKRRPFTLTAETINLTNEGLSQVEMTGPKADILMQNGSWIAVTAQSGDYDREAKLLKLRGNVNLFHDSGYEFHTDAAIVDLFVGDARGTDPVEGQGPFGNLKAEGFVIHNRGERVEFTGKSTLVLYPGQAPGG